MATASSPIPIHCSFHAMVALGELKPNPANPQKHPEKQIALYAEVLTAHGWRKSVTVSRRSGLVVRGHGALLAARRLGLQSLPVEFQDYTSEVAELQDMLADNRLPEFSSTDRDQLGRVLAQIQAAGALDAVTGYSAEDVASILEQVAPTPTYPITARLNERHDFVLIFADNETDFQFLKNLCGVRPEQSYKNTTMGEGRAVPFARFLQSLCENRDSIPSAGVHHDDAPPSG